MAHLDRSMVPLYLKDSERDQLDIYAEITGVSRQKLLEAIISTALDDLEIMDKLGILIDEVRIKDQIELFRKIPHEQRSLVNNSDADGKKN